MAKVKRCITCKKMLVGYHPSARYCLECKGKHTRVRDAEYHRLLRARKKASLLAETGGIDG